MKIPAVVLLFSALAFLAEAHERRRTTPLRLSPYSEMTPAQRAYADAVMAGRSQPTGSAASCRALAPSAARSHVYLRSPALAERLRPVGRADPLPELAAERLKEFAILVTRAN